VTLDSRRRSLVTKPVQVVLACGLVNTERSRGVQCCHSQSEAGSKYLQMPTCGLLWIDLM